MYTLFPNIHTKAVCALENGQGISIGKILNCHIMVKKWGEKNENFEQKWKKWGAMKKMKKNKK